MSETTTVPTQQHDERRRRRGVILRFGLAGVAVLGVGAAATSAAWTDDAWFTGSASAAQVELQGSIDGTTWFPADTKDDTVAVKIPDTVFAQLNQGAEEDVVLHLKNAGDVPLTLGAADVVTDGALFAGSAPAEAAVTAPAPATLAAGATTTVTLTVTTPSDWPESYQDAEGSLTVQFTGQS